MPWEGFTPPPSRYADRYVQLHLDEHEGGSAEPQVFAAVKSLSAAGAGVEVYEYPGTGHAFFNDARPEVYDADAAALAWSRSLDYLRTHVT
jgi:carboxymethylenebutenolidase